MQLIYVRRKHTDIIVYIDLSIVYVNYVATHMHDGLPGYQCYW